MNEEQIRILREVTEKIVSMSDIELSTVSKGSTRGPWVKMFEAFEEFHKATIIPDRKNKVE